MNIINFLEPGKSTNVIAAAGTGKTWFIISKILRLLLEDIEPDKITAITFTKKASSEMRNRLNNKIEDWSKMDDEEISSQLKEIGIHKNNKMYSKKAKKLFLKIQLNIKDIRISTFDAFFLEILGQLYLDKDIPNNIYENKQSMLISKEVERKIFNKKFINNNLFLKKHIEFLSKHIGSFFNTKKAIIEIIEKKQYFLEINKVVENEKSKVKGKDKRVIIQKEKLINFIINRFEANKNLKENYANFFDDISSNEINVDKKISTIINFFFTKTDRLPRKAVIKYFKKINVDIDNFINQIFLYEESIFFEIQESWKILAKNFFEEYQNTLDDKNLHDFSDNTWLCYKKLSYLNFDNWIFYKISNSIHHLLIDEFQDTNFIQWKIISLILNSMNDLGSNNSVTIVGDSKQSIYGFRGSEPKLFDVCREFTKKKFNAEELFLNESRRSTKEIVSFVNSKFNTGDKFCTKINIQGNVEVNTLKRNEDTENTVTEAEIIASQIEDMILAKNLKYKDIVILIRNRTHICDIENSLIKKSIPVTTDKKESLLNNVEIQDLFYLLKYLVLNEHNHYELFLLLTSPIFNFNTKDIQKINTSEFEVLEEFLLNSKYKDFIKKWKKQVGKVPMHDLIDIIYHDIDIIKLYECDNSLKNKNTKENFLKFLNMSLNFNNGRFITPFQFLNHLEKTKDNTDSYENLMEDSVKIMTIHSAKGLESEVIFLAQTYLPNSRKSKLKIVPDFNDDLSCKDLYLNIPKVFKNNYYIENNFLSYNGKEILEENNLLYVACTRAKKFLIINGFTEKKYSQSWFSNFLISQ